MFGPGLLEYLTLIVDPVIACLLLRRWSFRFVPTAIAWVICTVMALTLAGIVVMSLGALVPLGAGAAPWAPIAALGISAFTLPRAILIRRLSASRAFRSGDGPVVSWRASLTISVVPFAAAMLSAMLVGLLIKVA